MQVHMHLCVQSREQFLLSTCVFETVSFMGLECTMPVKVKLAGHQDLEYCLIYLALFIYFFKV